jgi:murein DD-endopeptidase MepM/ murein hydrolase activator NlpD
MPPRVRRAILSAVAASAVAGALIALPQLGPDPARTAPAAEAAVKLRIVFPVKGRVWFSDSDGACRSGCARRHQGIDIMGRKMQKLVAVAPGRITSFKHTPQGNYLTLTTKGGWSFNYLHLNNDRPGTDDNRNFRKFAFVKGLHRGSVVKAGQVIAYMGDSGNAEQTSPHLHFEIRKGSGWGGKVVNPYWSLRRARHIG